MLHEKDECSIDSFPVLEHSNDMFPSKYNIGDKSYASERTQPETGGLYQENRQITNEDITKYTSTGAHEEYTAAIEEDVLKQPKLAADYGRKVADRNIDGMLWFQEAVDSEELRVRKEVPELNGRETRKLIFSSVFAALMVAGVFILGIFIFLMFCTLIWF